MMKKLFVLLIVIGPILYSGRIFGQAPVKLGHINSQLLLAAMPETDSAQRILERSQQQMQETLDALQVEFNKKYEEYLKLVNEPTTGNLILRTKEEELSTLQQRAQTFQTNSDQELSDQQAKLFQPIQAKALQAVSEVAKEGGYTYIFDVSGGILLYTSADSDDILPLVKKKLGLE